jgi:flagellar biosynthesis/type III secretory pathway protein FliH
MLTLKKLARQEGLAEGREEGLKEGRQEGLKEGRQEGLKEGLKEGRQEGRQEGLEHGQLIGRIWVYQEELGREPTSRDVLLAMSESELRGLADTLRRELAARRASS